jgi:hypothetical protein
MADPNKQCPYDAVTWDGVDRVSSSGELLSSAQQLAAVSRQYLQHLAQHYVDLPTNVEGAWRYGSEELIQTAMHRFCRGWLSGGGGCAQQLRSSTVAYIQSITCF